MVEGGKLFKEPSGSPYKIFSVTDGKLSNQTISEEVDNPVL